MVMPMDNCIKLQSSILAGKRFNKARAQLWKSHNCVGFPYREIISKVIVYATETPVQIQITFEKSSL